MTTAILFKIDPVVKKKAAKRAMSEGLTLSSVLKLATRAYAERVIDVQVVPAGKIPNAKTARELRAMHADVLAGRNLSPAFHNAKDLIAYLKQETGRV